MSVAADKDKELSSLQSTHDQTLVELGNYKLLVESVEDYAIFLLDPNGDVASWNKGAKRTKGYEASEIIGKHFSTFYTQSDIDAKKPEKELEIAKKFGRIEDEDWRLKKDGSRFWANVVITALFNESGKLVGFAKVTRDLTQRKRQEDDLRRANELLKKQQEELRRLNDSKDEFISLASHQLRTPATAVKQLLGLLLERFHGDMPPQHRSIVQKAYESNERQISIVNSLLQVAQLDAGRVTLNKSPVDINELLGDIIEEQADSFTKRGQAIVNETHAESIEIDVDTKYFRMALENLIDNASKYTYPGGRVVVSATREGKELAIVIQDNGVGIAGKDIGKLFKKFNRIPNDLSQKVSGSGLGLYWVEQIIGLHGGRIEVSSKPKAGTTFSVHVPLGDTYA